MKTNQPFCRSRGNEAQLFGRDGALRRPLSGTSPSSAGQPPRDGRARHSVRAVVVNRHHPAPGQSMNVSSPQQYPELHRLAMSPFVPFWHFQNRVTKRDKTCQNVPKSDMRSFQQFQFSAGKGSELGSDILTRFLQGRDGALRRPLSGASPSSAGQLPRVGRARHSVRAVVVSRTAKGLKIFAPLRLGVKRICRWRFGDFSF